MTDIMQSWKDNRFVVVPSYLDIDNKNKTLVVLTDIGYWASHVDELVIWCAENNCETRGMTVTLPDEESITLFCLKWSG